jgi:hypothetical protein
MTATIALTATEAEAIARANAALAQVGADTFPWPALPERRTEIKTYIAGLRDSLADYAALTTGDTHPASLFPELGRGQDDAMGIALDLVAQDIRTWTRELVNLAKKAEDAASDREEVLAA